MMLQKRYWTFLLFISLVLVLGATAIGIAQTVWNAKTAEAAGSQDSPDTKTITVVGNGELEVEPDVAYIHFAVMTRAATAEAAQQENATIFSQVDKVLFETYRLSENDVKTTGFQVRPEYSYSDQEAPKVTGYSATHSVQVTYRNLAEIGALLDALSQAGVNQMNHIQFGSEKLSDYELEALKQAMADARAKAETLAQAERRTLKGVLHINETGSGPVYGSANVGISSREMAAMDAASTSINPGEIKIRKQVTVQYEF